MKKLTLTPAELERFYELVCAANEVGVPMQQFTRLDSPLACALRSIPVPADTGEAFADGAHTEALMGCIMGALHQITSTLESNRWLSLGLQYRFLGMCSPEGKYEENENLDGFMLCHTDLWQDPSEKMTSFAFEPNVRLYEVEPSRTLAMCKLYSESYSCLLVFEIIANNS